MLRKLIFRQIYITLYTSQKRQKKNKELKKREGILRTENKIRLSKLPLFND